MICYQCGMDAGKEEFCPGCHADLRIFRKIEHISNAYYNDGLQKANVRNLSGAVISLKQSLKFNKYNTDARNLLGLIYYEMGEVVEALSEWVISKNYQQQDNRASGYLDAIQKNRSTLENINQTIKKYNQALAYCHNGSRDLAVIQLRKVLNMNPNMLRAQQLLALLYMEDEKYDQAKKTLRAAGKIDTDNTTTLRYLKEVNARFKEKNTGKKKKDDDLISYQSGNETIIMPKRFKESSIGSTLIYILIGLVVGVAVTAFLIVPGVKAGFQAESKKQQLEATDTINTNNQTIESLNKQISDMQAQLDSAQSNQDEVQTQINSYEGLLNAYVTFTGGDVLAAGDALAAVDSSKLSESAQGVYNTIKDQVDQKYKETLYNTGYSAYSKGDYETAINDLKKITDMDEAYSDGSAAYYLAQSYRKSGDTESAKPYYQYIIDNYPDTERASTARSYVDAQQ